MVLPKFTYFPDPIKEGSIEASDKVCQCCNQSRGFIYTRNIYCIDNINAICPWCIHDGSASKKFDASFNYDIDDSDLPSGLPSKIANEISCETPSFASFQQLEWQAHCGDGCEFHGLATVGDFLKISENETERLKEATYLDDDEIEEWKKGDPSTELHYLFKFKCRHCNEIRFVMDLD